MQTNPLPYLWTSRHGALYVRRNGRRVRMTEAPGTNKFLIAYAKAVADLDKPPEPKKIAESVKTPRRGTWGRLTSDYFKSPEFLALDPKSQRNRRNIIEACLQEKHKGELLRECPVSMITPAKIKALRDAKKEKRGAANNRKKYMSAMFGWAIEEGRMKSNPARDVRRFKYATEGFHNWTVEEVIQFQERWPIGTKQRLALSLILFLGVRRGDLVVIGRQHETKNRKALRFVPRKTRYKRVEPSEKPILPVLRKIIDQSPTGALTYLQTMYGKPYTAAGFGGWFRTQCDLAGLPQCSAHGLRKAGATLCAEEGATIHQLMAIFDWATPGQAEVYTRAADRRRLAAGSMHLLGRR